MFRHCAPGRDPAGTGMPIARTHAGVRPMLEPQSTVLFVLLAVAFCVLMWRMLVTRQVVTRVLAAGLAFTCAMTFGVMAVNKYYGYYQTWGAAVADLTSQGISVPQVAPSAFTSGALSDGSTGA